MNSLSPKIILLVKNRALGDSIMGLSTVSYLRKLYPESKIIYGVPSWVAPLYKNVSTDADEILAIDFSSLRSWWTMWWKIKKISPDHIHEMHLAGRSHKFFELFSSFNGVKYSFHNHHLLDEANKENSSVHDQGVIKPLIQRDLDGAWSAFQDEGAVPNYLKFIPRLEPTSPASKKNIVIFGVVATRATKMWSLESYVELAKLIKDHQAQSIVIPLSKSTFDGQIEKKLQEIGLPDNCEIIKLPLEQLPLKLAECQLYIGNDTGLKHLAIALGIKTFTFFGPEPPLEWHPYEPATHPYFYRDNLDCRTATSHYCGLSQCDSMICLDQISPGEVFTQIQKDLL